MKNEIDSPKTSGRPPTYNPSFEKQAEALAKLGATDKEVAAFFNVTETAINNWKLEHPQFLESLKSGKLHADSHVAEKLFQRAIGYEHPEDQIFQFQGQPVVVPTTKRYPPDTTAAIFWLKNRRASEWRDAQQIEFTVEIKRLVDVFISIAMRFIPEDKKSEALTALQAGIDFQK